MGSAASNLNKLALRRMLVRDVSDIVEMNVITVA